MKNFLMIFVVALTAGVYAVSFKGEILCDPVNEINSLTISKDAVVQPSFHYIDGIPVQCLRISLLPGTSRTSLFVRIKVNDLSGKKVNFICAIAAAEKNGTAQCKLIANGAKLFDTKINTDQPVFFRATPTVDHFGSVNFSFEIFYPSLKDISPVDLILPALIDLKKINNSTQKSDIQFGTTDSNKTWKIAGTENINSDFKETDNVFLVPEIKLIDINSKSIEPRDGKTVKIIATLKNSGWKDYTSSPDNAIKIYVDKKSGVIDEKKQTQLIPDIPAGGVTEIEWMVHTHKKISEIKGEIVSVFLNQKKKFNVPLYSPQNFCSKMKSENRWEIIVNPKENLIAYDWVQDNLKIRFIKSSDGIQRARFMVKNNGKFKTVATTRKLAMFDIITPNNQIKTLTFLPKSARYFEPPENKVVLRGWIFSKETGGLIIEQYYSHPANSSEINIETKIFTKNDLKIAKISNPVFNLEADGNSTIIIPGFQFKKLTSTVQPQKRKWMFNNSINYLVPFSKQLIPFAYAGSLGGSICFENPKGSFGNNNNMMWLFKKSNAKTRRYTIANIAKPAFGNTLKKLRPKESFSIKTSVKIVPENVAPDRLLPNVLQLGVVPVPLIDAEKERLMKKFIMSIDSTIAFDYDEINKQIGLLRSSKSKKWNPEITAEINKIYSNLLTKIHKNKNVQNELLDLCTQLDWTLDKKITGKKIISRSGTRELPDKILKLLIEGKKTGNEDSVSLGISLLSKLRGKLIFSSNNIPSLSAYAKLAKANIKAYKITENKLFLKEADRLLLLGEVFMKKKSKSATRGIGMAEENVGLPTPGNYEGLFSTEATLSFVDALFDAAEADKTRTSQNNRLANLLLNAVEKFYLQQNKNGLIPEFFSQEFNTVTGKYVRPYLLWEMFLRQNKLLN